MASPSMNIWQLKKRIAGEKGGRVNQKKNADEAVEQTGFERPLFNLGR